MIAIVIVSASLLLARAWHSIAWRRVRQGQRALRGFTPDGIVAGAEGFLLRGGNGRGVLLLHGSGDTPQSLRYLAERLHDAGFTVHVPLLPGHGRDVGRFASVTERAYAAAADAGLVTILRETDRVAVGGLSMGGALAARLAADRAEARALVLLAPYLEAPSLVRRAARLSRFWGLAVPFVEGRDDRSIHDQAAASKGLAYGVFSPAALRPAI